MVRARTLALAVFVTLVSLGLGAGLAYRWMLREMVLDRARRPLTLAAVLRPRGNEGRALLWGIAFLPIFWGGLLTFLSPWLVMGEWKAGALVLPWVTTAVLAGYLRFLYGRCVPVNGELLSIDDLDHLPLPFPGHAAWRRHIKVTLWCGLPGLVLCTAAMSTSTLEPLIVIGLLAAVPAVLSPWIGALSALHVVVAGGHASTDEPWPARPQRCSVRAALAVAALSLLALWAVQLRELVALPRRAPLLSGSDFDVEELCTPPSEARAVPDLDATPDAVRLRLEHAGAACGQYDASFGSLELGHQRLDWCDPYEQDARTRFVATSRDGETEARSEVDIGPTRPVPTRAGVALLERQSDGWRLVRLGTSLREEAAWRLPGATRSSWTFVERGRPDGLVVAWDRADGGVALQRLSDDLLPIGRTRVTRASHGQSVLIGKATCLYVDGGILVFGAGDRPYLPAVGERIGARAGTAFHMAWTAIVFAVIAGVALGAGRVRRRLARSASTGRVCEGTLSLTELGVASLRRTDGDVVRLLTDGAVWHGYPDGDPQSGPCVVVDAGLVTGAAAYRTPPAQIDGAATFGIVRGDLSQARAWATSHRDRILATAVLVGWIVTGPTLLILALGS